MPGRNPQEAVQNLIAPLARAVGVLDGWADLHLSRRGGYHLGQELTWILNEGAGLSLANVGTFFAEMGFQIVESDPKKHEGRYRVTTLRYRYRLESLSGVDRWRAHWHPDGNSRVKVPHIHLPPDLKLHFEVPRISFEQTLQWCIQLGAPLSCSETEAERVLAETHGVHVLYRTWVNNPSERQQS